jgi:hypothetical protein
MKCGKKWAKKKARGSMRWERDEECLAQQWVDNRVVTMLSAIDNANEYVTTQRKSKVGQKWTSIEVKQPRAVDRYNSYMNAVDRSDQILSKNNLLRKCLRWWKVLFFHMIDISIINSYILFEIHRKANPGINELKRPKKYSVLEFREELVRDLTGFVQYGNPPLYDKLPKEPSKADTFHTDHMVEFDKVRRSCKLCYKKFKTENKVHSFCSAPQCEKVYLHCTPARNCFKEWHSKDCDRS